MTFTQAFKYLGSLVTSNLRDYWSQVGDDLAEVDARIRSAYAAFTSLRVQLFGCKAFKLTHKKSAYEGLVLGLLLRLTAVSHGA